MSPLWSVDFKHPLFPAMNLPAAESSCLQLCFRPGLRLLERRGRTGCRQGSLGLEVMGSTLPTTPSPRFGPAAVPLPSLPPRAAGLPLPGRQWGRATGSVLR